MSDVNEFCLAVFKAFAPLNTDSVKYLGVSAVTINYEYDERDEGLGIIEKHPTPFCSLDITFSIDYRLPETRREGYRGSPGKIDSGGWFRGSCPLSVRMRRDEMAEKLCFSKGQQSASSS